MCGRFTLRAPASVIAEQFRLSAVPPFSARFNIAPTQPVLAVRAAPERELVALVWGLVPSWAKDAKGGARMINARAETLAQRPAFRAALRHRRCLIPADGFYEWPKAGRARQPFFYHMIDERPFAMAGLWESWEGAGGGPLETCTIVTTQANELVAAVHDRMPVILAAEDYDRWLDGAVESPEEVVPLLRPYPSQQMRARRVGPLVNRAAHDGPDCIEPVE